MALAGNGREYDVSFLAGDGLKTTTSQYRVVCMIPGTSTTLDHTVDLAGFSIASGTDFTAGAYHALGVNQSYLDSNSVNCNVRLLGLSKAICALSVPAGSFVIAYNGASITTRFGCIQAVPADGTTMGVYGATASARLIILGRALESGSTGQAITIFVNPQLYDKKFLNE